MRKPRTFVHLLVDASTSMLGVAKGVRVGINAYVADLCTDTTHDYRLSLTTFAETYTQLCSAVPPAEVPRLDEDTYVTDGQTALLDAVGACLDDFAAQYPQLDPDDRVLFVLATDGVDNHSRIYRAAQVLQMVREREASNAWTFIHMAAGPDCAQQSPSLGLRHVIAIAQADLAHRGTYDSIGAATRAYADGDSSGDITALLAEALAGARR